MFTDLIVYEDAPAEEFVASLEQCAAQSPVLEHPLLRAIAGGAFHDRATAIKVFLREYYFYSRGFTRYLTSVISQLDEPTHRTMLMSNVMEEGGVLDDEHKAELEAAGIDPVSVSVPHPELFRRFLHAIGLSQHERWEQPALLATTAWIESFDSICRHSGPEQAIGALGIGTEGIVRHLYLQILSGIKTAWPQLSLHDRAFFELHARIDDEHAEVLREIAVDLCQTPQSRRALAIGVSRALDARRNFFDHLLLHLRQQDLVNQSLRDNRAIMEEHAA